ncbi:MAG: flavodoxin family protein [Chloroflexi bacterium]|nr:flavodoxin family protein [Chloroflexota bacterium]
MQRVKLLGINGSPRPQGNSQFLLEQALQEATATASGYVDFEVYQIGTKVIAPCDSCYTCAKTGECHIQDDFQELRDKWGEADAIIYSIPVYHMTIPGKLRCFIDRLGNSIWARYGGVSKSLRVIGSITQGSHIFSGQEHAITDLINHALVMGCVPISGDLWESYIGASGWTRNSTAKDAIRKLYMEGDFDAQVAVEAARSLGRRVIQLALLIKTGGEHHRQMLERDGGYKQFLMRLA